MDTRRHNQLATLAACSAILLSLASMFLPDARLAGLAGTLGLAAVVAANHLVRPGREGLEARPNPVGQLAGVAAAGLLALVGLLLVAAVLARFGGASYLGSGPIFLAEHFTIITGPFVAAVAIGPLLAARGLVTLHDEVMPVQKVVSGIAQGTLLFFALLIALDVLPTEPWQTPYLLAFAGIGAWLDATRMAGLPTPARVGHWIERGETAQSRLVLRASAMGGNITVILLAAGGAAAGVVGYSSAAVALELLALFGLVFSTHAAAVVRKAAPIELEEDISSAKEEVRLLSLLSVAPVVVTAIGAVATAVALVGTLGSGSLLPLLESARPGAAILFAVLAGVNLARSRLRTYEDNTPVRKAVATTTVSFLMAHAFFSVLAASGVMSGPILDSGIFILFAFAATAAAGAYVLTRGLYPIPGTGRLKAKKGPKAKDDAESYKARVQRTLYAVYFTSGAFLLGAIGLVMAVSLGVLDLSLPQSQGGRNAAFLGLIAFGLLLIIGLVVVFFQSRQMKTPPSEGILFKKKATPDEVMRLVVLGVSITLALGLFFFGVLVQTSQLTSLGAIQLEAKHSTDFFVFAILLGLGPAGFLHNRERKRIRAIDARLPEFLRDLAESQRTGMTLTQAVITAAKGNYGALTPEIRKMAAQIEWGVSFDNALVSFSKRVNTPLVQRTVSLIIEASNSGGNVIDVLTAASDDAREIQMINSERKGGMQIYVMIIYIAFLVFLGVIAVLNVKFMPEVAKAVAGAEGVTVGSITFAAFDIQGFRTLFFHAAIIQGLGGGFVAGAMEDGKPVAGLKHAFAMTVIAYVAFRFFLGG